MRSGRSSGPGGKKRKRKGKYGGRRRNGRGRGKMLWENEEKVEGVEDEREDMVGVEGEGGNNE
jgi:hypothetical protein